MAKESSYFHFKSDLIFKIMGGLWWGGGILLLYTELFKQELDIHCQVNKKKTTKHFYSNAGSQSLF